MDGLMEGLKLKYLIMFILLSSLGFAQIQQQHLSVIARKNVAVGGVTHVTDSLYAYWEGIDVNDGAVTVWIDRINTPDTVIVQGSAANQPTASSGIITGDGGDFLGHATGMGWTPHTATMDSIAIEWVGMFTDTSAGVMFVNYRNADTQWLCLGINDAGQLFAYRYSGTIYDVSVYSLPYINTTIHILVTSVEGEIPKMYINGEAMADIGGTSITPSVGFWVMATDGGYIMPNGSQVQLIRFYLHKASGLLSNYNSDSVQDKLP